MTNEEILLISDLLDKKLKPINERTLQIELLLENNLIPRLQNIESCYTDTYRRYSISIEEMDALKKDVSVLKQVVQEHSEKLKQAY